MANRAFLRVWTRDFSETTLIAQFARFLATAPLSASKNTFKELIVQPVDEFAPVITSDGGGASAAIDKAENTGQFVTTVTTTDEDAPAGPGEIRRGDEPVVAAADDDRVPGRRHQAARRPRERSTSRAAIRPFAPMIPPPGWVADPHSHRSRTGVRKRA